MEEKKTSALKCFAYTFGMYAFLSFFWTAILSLGTKIAAQSANAIADTAIDSSGISEFATRLVKADAAFAVFALVFGFSFLIFNTKMSDTAKRSIHIILNYIAAMVCTFIVHTTANAQANATAWVSMLVIWTFVFFAVYGIAMLVSFFVKRAKNSI